jgi:hypothetical protein
VARVFVSHADEDRECAGQLRQWLVNENHEVCLDQDLRDGMLIGDKWNKRHMSGCIGPTRSSV